MIDHMGLSVSDLSNSRAFYEAALAPLGYTCILVFDEAAGFGVPPKPDFWLSRKKENLQEHHDHSPFCADFHDTSDQYGPKCEFSVIGVGILRLCGGYVDIKLKNGQVMRLLHFWTLNRDLHDAHSGSTLPAGTYLGSTARHIGFTQGPHLHVQSQSMTPCNTWINWMHGEFGSADAGTATPDAGTETPPVP